MSNQTGTIRSLLLQLTPFSPLRWSAATLTWLFDLLCLWQARSRERDQLLSLTDEQLKDIGLSRGDAMFEAGRRGRHYY